MAAELCLATVRPKESLRFTDDVVFHTGCTGPAPEFREFSEAGLRAAVASAGFREFHIYSGNYPPFGIVQAEAWSLPVAARRGPFSLGADAARDIVEHWRDAHHALKRIGENWWFRAGRKLRVCGARKLGIPEQPTRERHLAYE